MKAARRACSSYLYYYNLISISCKRSLALLNKRVVTIHGLTAWQMTHSVRRKTPACLFSNDIFRL